MRYAMLFAVAFALPGLLAAGEPLTFAKADADRLPAGWTIARTGEGKGSEWRVVAADDAPGRTGHALAQTAAGPSRLFNLCVRNDGAHADLELSVMIKSVSGDIDQGGGLLWRYQDANNYYICRYNPLEENYRLYKVIDGKRIQLATAEKVAHPEGKWLRLEVAHAGARIECRLEGKLLLEAEDSAIAKAGKIGLWTKADAHTRFDQLIVRGK